MPVFGIRFLKRYMDGHTVTVGSLVCNCVRKCHFKMRVNDCQDRPIMTFRLVGCEEARRQVALQCAFRVVLMSA